MTSDGQRDPARLLGHVDHWVFDLDNTLYPSESNLFAQVDIRMTEFVADFLGLDQFEARKLQKQYYKDHGTTLAGLMQVHQMNPDAFLDYVHDIDLSPIDHCLDLRAAIEALPGRKYVFTNGSQGHAERVLEARGLTGLFTDVADIASVGFEPKPHAKAYHAAIAQFDLNPNRAAFFEDMVRNLDVPKQLGFGTVLVQTEADWSHEPEGARPASPRCEIPAYVDFTTTNLTQFLQRLTQ